MKNTVLILISFLMIPNLTFSQVGKDPKIWMAFENITTNKDLHISTFQDKANFQIDTIKGSFFAQKDGIAGKSLLLDGISSYAFSENMPTINGYFTVEGWLALGAYPTNFAPIAEQCKDSDKGFSLGINALGYPEFRIALDKQWVSVTSTQRIPLLNWTHIAGVYDGKSAALYVNGEKVTQLKLNGQYIPAQQGTFTAGVSLIKSQPVGTIRKFATEAVYHFFDGLLDEIKVWDKVMDESFFKFIAEKKKEIKSTPLSARGLPVLSKTNHFGASYANLHYYESWDNFWRVSGLPDIVVNFEQLDGHFVFWRGTSYVPHWVTENGIWYNNEFCETFGRTGCLEPMSDKRCEHSQVKILENTPARCIIHWRYALVDNWYQGANIDPITGWGDWVDEFYTIYPNGVTVRSQTLHSNKIYPLCDNKNDYKRSAHEWQESILVMGQGQTPEKVLYPEAIILANMDKEEHVYSWKFKGKLEKKPNLTYVKDKTNRLMKELKGANIQLVNTRSHYKPFVVIDPDDNPVWDVYKGEIRRDISMFPWWNHWPTALKPSDGRFAFAADRASHSSLSHVFKWKAYKRSEYAETRLMLVGLFDKKASDLVPLTKAWTNPNRLTIQGNKVSYVGYNKEQMAYQIRCESKLSDQMVLSLYYEKDRPIINPAFVISNWNRNNCHLKLNGQEVTNQSSIKMGYNFTDKGIDLIIWINKNFENDIHLTITE